MGFHGCKIPSAYIYECEKKVYQIYRRHFLFSLFRYQIPSITIASSNGTSRLINDYKSMHQRVILLTYILNENQFYSNYFIA